MKNAWIVTVATLLCTATCAAETPGKPPKINPGETWTLSEDLILKGADILEVNGTKEKPCAIIGNGHQVMTDGDRTGLVKITYCTVKQLGKEAEISGGRTSRQFPAFDLSATGNSEIIFEHCTFDGSSSVAIANWGNSTTRFCNNVMLENCIARADKDPGLCAGGFYAKGNSPAKKAFQGNRIYIMGATFEGPHWLIGGDTDAESNIVIGLRAGIIVLQGEGVVIKHNYVHVLLPVDDKRPYWSQATTLYPVGDTSENVIRSGHWIVQNVRGDFHDNLVTEVHGHNWLRFGQGKIHHNIFAHVCPTPDRWPDNVAISSNSGIFAVYKTDRLEVYNNVLDGGNVLPCAVEIPQDCSIPSFRNNVVYGFALGVHPRYYVDKTTAATPPDRLDYADYNCFFNPKGTCHNYGVGVAGKKEKLDDGFARHDLPVGGQKDAQVDPKFKGPLPDKFPFSDEDVKSGKVTVSQILKFYRDAYSPAPGSPLLGAGDPADGAGTDIGAVQLTPLKLLTPPAKMK